MIKQLIKIDSLFYITDNSGMVCTNLEIGRHHTSILIDSFEQNRTYFPIVGVQGDTVKVYLTASITQYNAIKLSGEQNLLFNKITLKFIPSFGNGTDFVKLMPGVFSQSELTSQYNVRGGNYDENLVYVNDIEIYRPQLVRTGQQEGLSFINPDLINNIKFYPGGFEAIYGDKLSSVLDVKYLQPDSFTAGFSAGLMGVNAFIADKPSEKVSYLFGARYRANNYLLNSLDVKGQYNPRFYDLQGVFTYKPNFRWTLSYLGNLGLNLFSFVPVSQTTRFGTINRALQLSVAYAGLEQMNYINGTNAISISFKPDINTEIKYVGSLFNSLENEYYTVRGAYDLGELDNNLGSDNFGKKALTIGAGYFINHARNDLQSYVVNNGIIGKHFNQLTKVKTEWRIDYKREAFEDRVLEWKYNDSAEVNIAPFAPNDDSLNLSQYQNSSANLLNNQWSAALQKIIPFIKKYEGALNIGIRGTYRSLGNHYFFSPRFRFTCNPWANRILDSSNTHKKLQLNINGGYYYQPAYYREMRNLAGVLNTDILPQKSIHLTLGVEYFFHIWGRKFKYTGDIYGKYLDDIIPYAIENVRIRYFAINNGRGYAAGFDNRIYGEFIKNLESWFNLAFLTTKEQFTYTKDGIITTTPWLRRPTDARVVGSIFFQDDLPNNKTFRMSMMLTFASSVPFYFIEANRYTATTNKIPSYQRVDIGFQKLIFTAEKRPKAKWLSQVENAFISLDVFNLLGNNNIISYNIFKDYANNYYGVPNYLTGRRLNLRLFIGF